MNNKENNEHIGEVENDKLYQIRQSQIGSLMSQINKSFRLKISEIKTLLLGTVIVISIVSYLFYDTMKYIRDELRQTNTQIDIVLSQNTYMTKNMKALSGTVCYTCHNTSNMFLPKTTLKLDEFVKYVRGDRFMINSKMPTFNEKEMSYDKLQEIWKTLY